MNDALTTKTTSQIVSFERKKKISVSIVEEYFLTRTLFKQILLNDKSSDFEFQILNDFSDANDCICAIEADNIPDVIMMNLSFADRNDINKIRNIRVKYPDIKILVITTHENMNEIITCLELGVLGYILKDADKETIKEGVKQAYLDKIFVDPSIIKRIEERDIKIAG